MEFIPEALLKKLSDLEKTVTPAPWFTVGPPWLAAGVGTYVIAGSDDPHTGQMVCDSPDIDEWPADEEGPDYSQSWADLEFIAQARGLVPRLLAENAALREVYRLARAVRQARAEAEMRGTAAGHAVLMAAEDKLFDLLAALE